MTTELSMPFIIIIVFSVLAVYRQFVKQEILIKIIPVIAVLLGVVLGMLIYFTFPQYIADNLFMAIIHGGACGLAATGSHQVVKQLISKKLESQTTAK